MSTIRGMARVARVADKRVWFTLEHDHYPWLAQPAPFVRRGSDCPADLSVGEVVELRYTQDTLGTFFTLERAACTH